MISLAFLAGVLAAFNPCGFALLPAYLGSIIAGDEVRVNRWHQNVRAVRFSLGMTSGFIAVFGGFALLLTSFAGSIAKFLPLATIIVGVLLLAISLSLILGKVLVLKKLLNPNVAPTRHWPSQVGYGVSFALASLSCTIGPFLAITAAAIHNRDLVRILMLFLTYSLGMGSVVLTLALLVAAAKSNLIIRLKRSQGRISIASGYLLLIVGLYEIWYGWYEIRILHGSQSADPVISFTVSLQSKITQWISSIGTGPLILTIAMSVTLLLFLGLRKRRAIQS